ncbi:hypothetical protein [Pedobacter sp. FW305-3-2-15-E-R2A2]|uniref:hypothetical protein n=1 Tax=Pedobacter sp. FW305-3-2-15-E-R2A2 TaxID=3140251 RepID=UPI0031404025
MANWYAFNGSGSPGSPLNYMLSANKPSCVTGTKICAIYLDQSVAIPTSFDAGSPMQTYLANALLSLVSQPLGVGVKRFVYLKCNC